MRFSLFWWLDYHWGTSRASAFWSSAGKSSSRWLNGPRAMSFRLHICWELRLDFTPAMALTNSRWRAELSVSIASQLTSNNLLFQGFDGGVMPHFPPYWGSEGRYCQCSNQILIWRKIRVLSVLASQTCEVLRSHGIRHDTPIRYFRDLRREIHIPENYFKNDVRHRPCVGFSRGFIFNNWINHAVYQKRHFDWENQKMTLLFAYL